MIEIEGLTKAFGATTAVNDVSLTVERGRVAALVGTSGSGKTTLLRMINRLVEPTSGRVLIDGTDTAACLERYSPGLEIAAVRSTATNLKVTWPEDLEIAAALQHVRRGNRNCARARDSAKVNRFRSRLGGALRGARRAAPRSRDRASRWPGRGPPACGPCTGWRRESCTATSSLRRTCPRASAPRPCTSRRSWVSGLSPG